MDQTADDPRQLDLPFGDELTAPLDVRVGDIVRLEHCSTSGRVHRIWACVLQADPAHDFYQATVRSVPYDAPVRLGDPVFFSRASVLSSMRGLVEISDE